VNGFQARNWLDALAGCVPGLKLEGPRATLEAVGVERWGAGLCGAAGFSRLVLRAWGSGAAAALHAPPAPGRGAPAHSPDAECRWDIKTGARLGSASYAASSRRGLDAGLVVDGGPALPRSRRASPFRAASVGEPAAAATLAAFVQLCPATRVDEGTRWSLPLERPLPWARFLGTDVSAAFTPKGDLYALLGASCAIRELSFEEEGLWAYFEG
jgi:hypothetical protein